MTKKEQQIRLLKTAELQFRLAAAVRLASTLRKQSLAFPTEWVHGKHRIKHEDISLTREQADYAADFLQRSATYLLAVQILQAIKSTIENPKEYSDTNISNAYQITRTIRNAFTHNPFYPIWYIDVDCRNKIFRVSDIIELNTLDIDQKPFDWKHYGGLLAIFRLSEFVRVNVLGDKKIIRKKKSTQRKKIYQQGNLILKEVKKNS